MGIFDFLKKKPKETEKQTKSRFSSTENKKSINHVEFNSIQFQREVCAVALWKIEEAGYKLENARKELRSLGLDDDQTRIILELVKPILNLKLDETFESNLGIENNLFESETYQKEILEKAENWYKKNILNYELVKFNLLKEGLAVNQADRVLFKLRNKVTEMVNDLKSKLDSGEISEIKIQINPEHKKGNVDKVQIDKYIAFGAYQMDRGDLENALELFDKAIELDDEATLAYANKGKLFSLKNEHEKALFFTNKALEFEPNHQEILNNKVGIVFDLFQENKFTETEFISNITAILKQDPEIPNALIYMIQHHLNHNQMNEALQFVKRLFTNYFNEQITTQLMLHTLGNLSQEEALKQFDMIESEVNDDAKYQLKYNKGLYLKGIGKFDEAIKIYTHLNVIQEFSWNYYQIGIMKNLQNKTDESLKFLETTFRLEPELKLDARNFPELQNLWTNATFIELTK